MTVEDSYKKAKKDADRIADKLFSNRSFMKNQKLLLLFLNILAILVIFGYFYSTYNLYAFVLSIGIVILEFLEHEHNRGSKS